MHDRPIFASAPCILSESSCLETQASVVGLNTSLHHIRVFAMLNAPVSCAALDYAVEKLMPADSQ